VRSFGLSPQKCGGGVDLTFDPAISRALQLSERLVKFRGKFRRLALAGARGREAQRRVRCEVGV
jgi:hypothetical protein